MPVFSFHVVPKLSESCLKVLSKLSKNCLKAATECFECGFKIVAKWLQSCVEVVPYFPVCLKGVSKLTQSGLQIVLSGAQMLSKEFPSGANWSPFRLLCGHDMCWVNAFNLDEVAGIDLVQYCHWGMVWFEEKNVAGGTRSEVGRDGHLWPSYKSSWWSWIN